MKSDAVRRPSPCRARAPSGCTSRPRSRARRGASQRCSTIGSVGGGRRADDLGAEERRVDRRRDRRADLAARAPRRPRAVAPRSGSPDRRAPPASRATWPRACAPAPRIATRCASGRASARVATAETAAVRISVIGDAFMIATQLARSRRRGGGRRPCACRGRATGWSATMTISLSAYAARLAAAVRGHEAEQRVRARAGARSSGAGCRARRARATRAPRSSPRCTTPCRAARGRRARRGRSREQASQMRVLVGRELERERFANRLELLGARRADDDGRHLRRRRAARRARARPSRRRVRAPRARTPRARRTTASCS